jgi:hypothetical protein
VCFIDDEQADGAREQSFEELTVLEAFGSEIENLPLSVLDLSMSLTGFRAGEMRMHRDSVDAVRGELVVLVLHECDQWAHHDGEPRQQHCGELVDE